MMARITILVGFLLIVLGLLAYFVFGPSSVAEGETVSVTALIPAFFGAPLVVLGLLAIKDSLRKVAMHIAVLLGLLGFVGSLMRILPKLFKGESVELSMPVIIQLTMAFICLVFLGLCIQSFVAARRGTDD
jgi:uncharacterized membrane protein